MKENKRNKLKTTLQIIMYIFIILSFLRSFLAKASAEQIDSLTLSWFSDNFSTVGSNGSGMVDYVNNNIFNNCQYMWVYQNQSSFNKDVKTTILISNAPIVGGIFDTRYNNGLYRRRVMWAKVNYTILIYACIYNGSSWQVVQLDTSIIGSFNSTFAYNGGSSFPAFIHKYGRQEDYSALFDVFNYTGRPVPPVIANTPLYCQGEMNYYDSNYPYACAQYSVPDNKLLQNILYDDRFSAYTTLDDLGKSVLNVKWSSQVYPSTGSFNYLRSVLTLTIDKNGVKNNVSFDSDIYPELFISGNSSYIPYMYINKVGNIVVSDDSDILTLTNIQLVQYAYPSGSSSSSATAYTASTIYNLNLNTPEISNPDFDYSHSTQLDNKTVPSAPPVFDTPYFTDTNSIQIFPSNGILDAVSWFELVNDFPDWVDYIYITNSYTMLDSNLQSAHGGSSAHRGGGIIETASFDLSYSEWLRYACTYDYLIICDYKLVTDGNGGYSFDGAIFYLLKSFRYYIRLQFNSLADIQSILQVDAYYNKGLYDFFYGSFNRFTDNALDYFTASLDNQNVFVSWFKSVNTNLISISGILSSILDSISNLPTGGSSSYDLSALVDALQNKLEYLFVPSYDGFEDNISTAIDDIGVLAMPFYTVKYFLDSAKEAEYKETLDITFPSFAYSGTQYWDSYTASFNPSSIFPDDWFEFLQYCNLLFFSLAIALLTYKHIFGDSTDVRSNTL